MQLAELMSRIFVLMLGAGVVYFSAKLDYYSEFGPGPGFLPIWLGIGLIVCGFFLLLGFLRKRGAAELFFKPRTRECAVMFVLILISFLLLPWLGFPMGFALFAGAAMRIMGKHKWMTCGFTAFGIAIGIYFIFGQWLNIPLPTGLMGW